MKEILGIIFIIRLFYWLAVTILKCFGIIKIDDEEENQTENPNEPHQNEALDDKEEFVNENSQVNTVGKKKKPKSKNKKKVSKMGTSLSSLSFSNPLPQQQSKPNTAPTQTPITVNLNPKVPQRLDKSTQTTEVFHNFEDKLALLDALANTQLGQQLLQSRHQQQYEHIYRRSPTMPFENTRELYQVAPQQSLIIQNKNQGTVVQSKKKVKKQ